jgi:hypothetical protein
MRSLKREVTYDDCTYKVRSDKIAIPDFTQMQRLAVLIWLNQNTYARGYSNKKPNPLQGLGGAIQLISTS